MIRLTRWQLVRSLLAVLLIMLSWWGIIVAQNGLTVKFFKRESVPLLYIAPQQAQAAPGVLVAHGFAGSKQLMLGYGHVLAHAGYAVMLWDFDGHGANPAPLGGFDGTSLQTNLQVALRALVDQPEVDATRLALLGHSMGGSAVLSAGKRYIASPAQFATASRRMGRSVNSLRPTITSSSGWNEYPVCDRKGEGSRDSAQC
jgi:pimeloyl-ACP methyl ester carboxylesterase